MFFIKKGRRKKEGVTIVKADKLKELCELTGSKFAWVKVYRNIEEVEYALRFQTQTAVAEALDMNRPTFINALKRARREFEKNGAFEEFGTVKNKVQQTKKKPNIEQKKADSSIELPSLDGLPKDDGNKYFKGDL